VLTACPLFRGNPKVLETQIITRSGQIRDVAIKANAFHLQGRNVLLALFRDITERRRMEMNLVQAHKLESVGQLAAGIAHEINTPTQFIGDNLHFLREGFDGLKALIEIGDELLATCERSGCEPNLTARFRETIERVERDFLLAEMGKAIDQSQEGVQRVTSIVKAMKDFSHPGELEKAPIDINSMIKTTITVARGEKNTWQTWRPASRRICLGSMACAGS